MKNGSLQLIWQKKRRIIVTFLTPSAFRRGLSRLVLTWRHNLRDRIRSWQKEKDNRDSAVLGYLFISYMQVYIAIGRAD